MKLVNDNQSFKEVVNSELIGWLVSVFRAAKQQALGGRSTLR